MLISHCLLTHPSNSVTPLHLLVVAACLTLHETARPRTVVRMTCRSAGYCSGPKANISSGSEERPLDPMEAAISSEHGAGICPFGMMGQGAGFSTQKANQLAWLHAVLRRHPEHLFIALWMTPAASATGCATCNKCRKCFTHLVTRRQGSPSTVPGREATRQLLPAFVRRSIFMAVLDHVHKWHRGHLRP